MVEMDSIVIDATVSGNDAVQRQVTIDLDGQTSVAFYNFQIDIEDNMDTVVSIEE